MKRIIFKILFFSVFVFFVFMTACLSAGDLLEMAEDSWREGEYVKSIEAAVDSYNKAVDKNKEISDIENAKNFLIEYFPLANQYLEDKAKQQLEGSDTEKSSAWKIYNQLVGMNKMVRDSTVSSFLEVINYEPQLRQAKETSAQIQYVKALELIGRNERSSYIEAYMILKDINGFLPGFRDIKTLMDTTKKNATFYVAFVSKDIRLDVRTYEYMSPPKISSAVYQKIKKIIQANDYPEFLKFITANSLNDAKSNGAQIYIDFSGSVRIESGILDSYPANGTVAWERSYGGRQSLTVTRLSTGLSQDSESFLDFRQSVKVEFYPFRYNTRSLTADMYNNKFNNIDWMNYQLSRARDAIEINKGQANLVVWAEMQYGGNVNFLDNAIVDGVDMFIQPLVYESTQNFVNTDLKNFLRFSDINIEKLISENISKNLLADIGVNDFLTNFAD